MAITLRGTKGSELTHAEMDNNLNELDKIPNGKTFPKTQNKGIKIDTDAPDYGWHDLHGIPLFNPDDPNKPAVNTFIGGISCSQFAESNQIVYRFHIPHDYAMGTDIFVHAHWSHNSNVVTGGSLTWAFEMAYAKGHQQVDSIFAPTTVTTSVVQNCETASTAHHIAEASATIGGGSATQIDTALMEPDGLFLVRMYLDSNDITTSDLSTVNPFNFFVDLHYQSTGIPTKNREPNFWG